ncbi:hypothetical protein HCU64_14215 [Methylobacterium sp. C25]|uniref:hypothetical protein n=1 Tax=Methylobacterium sp. C25 TaxID=2721622 RepID=UPI001F268A94|nr:hypothetical protein [Methylobacterium sp. C25]MCE4224914.1 hypothetical protein [Methylobacterium sp. C25]
MKTAEAWAVASLVPARVGSKGYCASAWAITYDGWQTKAVEQVKASREPNRDEWLGGIKAVVGVLEDVEPGTALTIYVPSEALANGYTAKWTNSRGEPTRDAEAAQAIFRLRDEKRIWLTIEHRPIDGVAKALRDKAKAAAKAQDRGLTASDRREVAAADRAQFHNQFGGFPPAKDD